VIDLSTTYLGLRLPHPLMPGASPLSADLDMVRRLEDSGAAAIVLHSLFEEQIVGEELAQYMAVDAPSDSHAEARSYLPDPGLFALGPHDYLEHIARVKSAVAVPVIASLNGTSPASWIEYARLSRPGRTRSKSTSTTSRPTRSRRERTSSAARSRSSPPSGKR
jgi:dihydroorotate dehydrogenase (fumarate)